MCTRVRIEQCFGILKRRFAVLHDEMRLSPDRVCAVVIACGTLHNYALLQNDLLEDEEPAQDDQPPVEPDVDVGTGAAMRNHIMNTYFS